MPGPESAVCDWQLPAQDACQEGGDVASGAPVRAGGSAATHRLLVEALAAALDLREAQTGEHSKRVACHTLVLARRFVPDREQLEQIYWGSLLHDIGKIGVPDAVLLKPGPLDAAEWAVMRRHPELGYEIVRRIPGLDDAAALILAHEERFDGSGYPRGLEREAIPFAARLFAVIDTLDAMCTQRPYRPGRSFDAAKDEILRCAGRQFDPAAVEAFLAEEAVLRDMVERRCADASWAFSTGDNTDVAQRSRPNPENLT